MKHDMRLDPLIFEEMAVGLKKVEVRLNDEKRKKIRVGDLIVFHKRPECSDTLVVKVLEIKHYKTIKKLVDETLLRYWGPRFKTKKQLLNSTWHYSSDEIKQYGLLAIYLELQ